MRLAMLFPLVLLATNVALKLPLAIAKCETVTQELRELADGRRVACHVAE